MAKRVLLQTTVDSKVARKLDALAHSVGNTRAGYLRYLVESHVSLNAPSTVLGRKNGIGRYALTLPRRKT